VLLHCVNLAALPLVRCYAHIRLPRTQIGISFTIQLCAMRSTLIAACSYLTRSNSAGTIRVLLNSLASESDSIYFQLSVTSIYVLPLRFLYVVVTML